MTSAEAMYKELVEQILPVVKQRNSNWYPYLQGFLKGELEHLDLAEADIYEQELNIGNYDTCVVGEANGFKAYYNHCVPSKKNCVVCSYFADKLAHFSDAK